MLAYNGSVPGASLHIDHGSDITVQVTNDGDAAATVDWHGLRLDNRHDGVPNEAQAPIPIGRTFTCRLRVPWRRFLLVPPAQICLLCTGWVCIHLAAAPAQFGGSCGKHNPGPPRTWRRRLGAALAGWQVTGSRWRLTDGKHGGDQVIQRPRQVVSGRLGQPAHRHEDGKPGPPEPGGRAAGLPGRAR
jgi:Multicopper oxidase